MIKQFVVPLELQQFLTGLPGAALSNVLWDVQAPANALVIPFDPGATHRMLVYDKAGFSEEATPNPLEYNCRLVSLDGTVDDPITFARGI